MASRNALTEEGRTRIRNFSGRLTSYLVVWAVVGVILVLSGAWLRTRYGYLPLQRLYLSRYIKSSIKSFISFKTTSTYTILVRVIDDPATGTQQAIGCTDNEVTPVRDDAGRPMVDPKLGAVFRLRPGFPHRYFYWRTERLSDAEMHRWLRDHIYKGRPLLSLYWICFIPFPLIVVGGMLASVKLDLRINREYEEGRLLRGVRLLGHKEYARETLRTDGLGLRVLRPNKRT